MQSSTTDDQRYELDPPKGEQKPSSHVPVAVLQPHYFWYAPLSDADTLHLSGCAECQNSLELCHLAWESFREADADWRRSRAQFALRVRTKIVQDALEPNLQKRLVDCLGDVLEIPASHLDGKELITLFQEPDQDGALEKCLEFLLESMLEAWMEGTLEASLLSMVEEPLRASRVARTVARRHGAMLESAGTEVDWSRLPEQERRPERQDASTAGDATTQGDERPLRAASEPLLRATQIPSSVVDVPATGWLRQVLDGLANSSYWRAAGAAIAAAALLFVLVRFPTEEDGIKGIRGGVDDSISLSVTASLLVRSTEGPWQKMDVLEPYDKAKSPSEQAVNCPVNSALSFDVYPSGTGTLSLWHISATGVPELRFMRQASVFTGSLEQLPRAAGTPPGEANQSADWIKLEGRSGMQRFVVTLSKEAPPTSERGNWLSQVLSGEVKSSKAVELRCRVGLPSAP